MVAIASLLAVAACGTASDQEGGSQEPEASLPERTGFVGVEPAGGQPVRGGTLSVGVYSEVPSLDPAKGYADGVAGGTELRALYDTLMRYNPDTAEYEPRLAQSLEHSSDLMTWTLQLRPGVTFSDGTVLNSEAVKFSIERLAREKSSDAELIEQIARIETPRDLTVVFHLKTPWSGFPYTLTTLSGMVVSPTAVAEAGEDFGRHPVGAGPFTLDRYAPGEELVLKARSDYWGGRPYLESVRFVPLKDGRTRLEAFERGQLQMAFLRDAEWVVAARGHGYGGYATLVGVGEALLVNNRPGRPGEDPRIRQAIAYAINPSDLNRRVDDGKGRWGKELFPEGSRWHTSTSAVPYDQAKARSLVDAAKRDGYDGHLTLACDNRPRRKQFALSVQAELESVGFDVRIEPSPSNAALIRKIVSTANFDSACYGMNISDADPWVKLAGHVGSEGGHNRGAFSDSRMDDLLTQLQTAPSAEAKHQTLERIQSLWNETQPFVPLNAAVEFMAWDDTVQDVVPGNLSSVLLSDTWLSTSER